jgi:hypothetical protein
MKMRRTPSVEASPTGRGRICPLFIVALAAWAVAVQPCWAQEIESIACTWPVPGHQGTVKLRFGTVVQPKLGREVFNGGYFIGVPEGTPVLAIADGKVISTTPYLYLKPSLDGMIAFGGPPAAAELARYRVPAEGVTGGVSLEIGNGLTVYYSGLRAGIPVQVGQRVARGDTVGYSARMPLFFDEPVFRMETSRFGKAYDMGRCLFDSTYVPKKVGVGTYDPAKTYTSAELREDLTLLRSALEEGHPGLYTYTAKPEFDTLFDRALQSLDRPMTEAAFVRVLMPLIARIGCGHTDLIRSRAFEDAERDVFPMEVALLQGRCYVVRDWRVTAPLPARTELLGIDGMPIKDVCNRLRGDIGRDGHNETFPDVFLGRRFKRSYYESFGSKPELEVQAREPGGPVKTVRVPTMSRAQMRVRAGTLKSLGDVGIRDAVRFRILAGGVGYIGVSEFVAFHKDSIARMFRDLERDRVDKLIVDLRGNPGGQDENLQYLASFLVDRPYVWFQRQMVRSRGPYTFQKDTENYAADDTLNAGYQPVAGKAGFYVFPDTLRPGSQYHYDGDLVVLTDGWTFSAAAAFAGLLHRQGRAVLVGEETGGGYYELNAERFPILRLRHVPLTVRIPLVKIVLTDEVDPRMPVGHGVVPDHVVPWTLQDALQPSGDSVKEYARQLLLKGLSAR